MTLLTGCEKAPKAPEQDVKVASESALEIDPSLCDFHQNSCDKKLGETLISLEISPENTPSEKPLTVTLTSSERLEHLKVRVEGRDMFMGVIPLILSEAGKNTYQGTLIYGSCSSNYMVWRLIASFEIGGQSKTIMYDFLADNPAKNG
ncbi:hypothetical protein [Shewanella halotolerans]|uniref:hypothetical protein n=1 Tax=Shewanella halotolerans TaxID=2864204 RepID=UPI001C65F269|nr:hypothetical protein [Shewanella halotolerans]QYJ91826.1 hypothetical protein K0H81_09810 [Shewanella halotolerans]